MHAPLEAVSSLDITSGQGPGRMVVVTWRISVWLFNVSQRETPQIIKARFKHANGRDHSY
jgi:hypothetical protein